MSKGPQSQKYVLPGPLRKLSNLESHLDVWEKLAALVLDSQLKIRWNCFHFNISFQVFDE